MAAVEGQNREFCYGSDTAGREAAEHGVPLERLHEFDHSPARICIRQSPKSSLHIVFEMLRLAGRGDGAGYRWVCHDPFEEKLCPGLAIEIAGPIR